MHAEVQETRQIHAPGQIHALIVKALVDEQAKEK